MARRHRHGGLRRQTVDFGQIEAVRLAAAAANSKALLADARQAEQAVGQRVKVDDCRQGTHIERLGGTHFAALANQHHPEGFALAHTAPHHIDVAGFEYAQRQGPVREQHDIERK